MSNKYRNFICSKCFFFASSSILSFGSLVPLFLSEKRLFPTLSPCGWSGVTPPPLSWEGGTWYIGLTRIISDYIKAWAFGFCKGKQNWHKDFFWNYWVGHNKNISLELLEAICHPVGGALPEDGANCRKVEPWDRKKEIPDINGLSNPAMPQFHSISFPCS